MNEKLNQYKHICPYYEAKCEDLQCACPKYLAYAKIQEPGVIEDRISKMGVDPTSDKLNIMLGMQKSLGARFHKMDDLTKDEVDHWIKEYITCVEDELREVREHLNWLPWGDGPKENMVELKKEMIDIWHFLMDMLLVSGVQTSHQLFSLYQPQTADVPLGINPEHYLEYIMNRERTWMSQYHTLESISQNDRDWLVLFYHNCLQDAMGAVRQQISWKHWKKPNPEINYPKLHAAVVLGFKYLVDMMVLVGFSTEEWYDTYVKKNIENVLRQEAGY